MILELIQFAVVVVSVIFLMHLICWLAGWTYRKGDIVVFSYRSSDVATCSHTYEVLSCNHIFTVKGFDDTVVTKNEDDEIKVLKGSRTSRIHRGKFFQ